MQGEVILYEIYKELGVDHVMRVAVIEDLIRKDIQEVTAQIQFNDHEDTGPSLQAA